MTTGPADIVFHKLANLFNGFHWALGITTLPEKATPPEERSFVLMWLGVIAFIVVCLSIMFYLFLK